MGRTISENEQRARAFFAGGQAATAEECLQLARKLRDEDNNVEHSRRVLQMAAGNLTGASQAVQFKIRRDLVICTYKTPDQPVDERLKRAEELAHDLLEVGSLTPEQRQEVLGLLGAIWKNRWSVYGLREDLEKSLAYYREGLAFGEDLDSGYTGINTAFVLDLLSAVAGDPTAKAALQADANRVRQRVCAVLRSEAEAAPKKLEDFWFLATLGEAYLGQRDFAEAEHWMALAGKRQPPPWQIESTARQTAKLASLIAAQLNIPPGELESSKPWAVVRALMGGNSAAAFSFLLGKVGLALSGGGFRASLFHIGVLARLADLDMLRHVEVLSCVSGGSIVGAFYYLELRKKLQEKDDNQLKVSDYIEIVENLERKFLAGIQKNIRLRMLMEFKSNLRVLYRRKSSMTNRLAELYDRELYSQVEDEFGRKRRRLVSDLLIQPKGAAKCNPKYDNWTRRNKVPILILNATTLNTCHNWQFTVSFMGEPPARGIQMDIDANDRLRRMYHEDVPPAYQEGKNRVKLSEAVAASACVPMLFDPLVFDDLYGTTLDPNKPEKYIARLVDGGTYDNQGVASLLEQNCTVLLVSDACGQTSVALDPGGGRLEVLQRANDVLMARVREAQYQELATLQDMGALRGFLYVHLKKDLEGIPVDWVDCPDRSQRAAPSTMTNYGMRRDVQQRLAGIRTDLDSFSNCEADALMLSGYLMTQADFDRCLQHFPVIRGAANDWRFRRIENIAASDRNTPQTNVLRRALDIGSSIGFKPWKASRWLQAVGMALTLAILAALVYLCVVNWSRPLQEAPLTVHRGPLAVIAAAAVAGLALLRLALTQWGKYRNSYGQIVVSVVMCLVGWIVLRFHLYLIEPFYLRYGPRYGESTAPPQPPTGRASAAATGG